VWVRLTNLSPLAVCLAAFAIAVAATPLVRALARKIGAVAAPKKDRWHTAPTAMMGGLAIFAATIITILTLVPKTAESWIVLSACGALFIVGMIDDFVHLKPYQKLIGQLMGSAAVVYFGLVLPWTGSFVLNMIITFFWLVGVTNAVNMLDNMDGLAAGVAAIASAALAVTFFMNGQLTEALMLSAFFGALAGFLIYNHNPASIFMGDCGSMFVGFFLASTALLSSQGGGGRSRSVVAVLVVPVLVLCIPIFDTTFVTLMRKMSGRSASQGGRDHTSHRLVALGLSERHAVWMLYAFALMGGVLSVAVRRLNLDVSVAAIAGFAIVLGILGVYLGGVHVYSAEETSAAQKKPLVSFLIDLSYKRRIFEVALDVVLIVLAYYASYALLFGPARAGSKDWQLFLKTLPAIVFVQLATFLAVGVYRGLWRYAGLTDAFLFVKAVVFSCVASMLLVVFAFRFEGFTRSSFVLDALLLLAFTLFSRFAFRFIRKLLPGPHARTAKRVLIYGAGDAGELLWREMTNNAEMGYVPVGFVDDDPRKFGKVMHGLPVYSGRESLANVCARAHAEEVFLSTASLPPSKILNIVGECALAGAAVKRMTMQIQRVADAEMGWVLPTTSDSDLVVPIIASQEKLFPAERPHAV
jgi:UDP-GlcNAc:undecaprenyl-phosphate GlcNAc-1-phosphate transferase